MSDKTIKRITFIISVLICSAFFWGLIGVLTLLYVLNPQFLPLIKGGLVGYLFAVWVTSVYKLWANLYKPKPVVRELDRGYDNCYTYKTKQKELDRKMASDDIIKVNLSQAGSNNNDLMRYTTQLKQSGIIINLISENYVEPSSWNSVVVFTMNPDDLYKIPDIVDQQLIMDVITDDNNNFTTKEIAVIVYNNYIE